MSFEEACLWLDDAVQRANVASHPSSLGGTQFLAPSSGPDAAELANVRAEMEAAQKRLMEDRTLLDRLYDTRAINSGTADRFGIGYGTDRRGQHRWWFPIRDDNGQVAVVKAHADDGGQPKSIWLPKGAKKGDPFFPVCLDGNGPVWLAPGELKAAALISVDLAAVGITSGERNDGLSPTALASLIAMVGKRAVAIPIDNDEQGKTWGKAARKQLVEAGVDARIVDLGLREEGADVGDWLVERRVHEHLRPADVKGQLVEAFEAIPQAAPHKTPASTEEAGGVTGEYQPLCVVPKVRSLGDIWGEPTTWQPVRRTPTGIELLDNVLGGGFTAGGVHVIAGKPGNAKTQLAVQISTNAAKHRVPVGFITLEMSRRDISHLVLAQLSGMPRKTIEAGLGAMAEAPAIDKVKDALERFNRIPFDVMDGDDLEAGFTRESLAEVVDRGVRDRGWRLVVLDHIGELTPLDTDLSTNPIGIEKANITALRTTAKRLDITMLVVAPMRKAAIWKEAEKGNFSLDDVTGSAALGFAAVTCLGVAVRQVPTSCGGECLVRVLKNRRGATPNKPISLPWQPECGIIG